MTSVSRRFRMTCVLVGLLSASVMGGIDKPTITLKAIKINGSPIAATNSVSVSPGDLIECELQLSEWSPLGQKMQAFQIAISRNSFLTGSRGSVKPLGWDRPIAHLDEIQCATDSDCPAEFPVCFDNQFCVGPNYDPSLGISIDVDRPDWVFWCPIVGMPCGGFAVVDVSGVFIRYSAVLILQADANAYTIPPRYAGTLILEVSDDACGAFDLRILQPTDSALTDTNQISIEPLNTNGLSVEVTSPGGESGSCDCRSIIAASPENCTIDARQPKDPDGTNPQTWNSVTMTFDCADTSEIADAKNFLVSLTPGGFPPGISSIVSLGSDVTVTVIPRFPEKKWTCFTFGPSGDKVCLGVMPGDVNSDKESLDTDIPAAIACLNNPGTCGLHQCDLNRTDDCTSSDLLRLIDLLGGAATYTEYEGQSISGIGDPIDCPSAP